ncbi:MAG: aminotransferase class IV [Planctomycetota bacterium]
MPELAWLNGTYSSIADARVPVDDRGYQFGDGIYEVIRSYNGILWAMGPHMARLERSLREVEITGIAVDTIARQIEEAFFRSRIPDALIYLQITRGIQPRTHVWRDDLVPSMLITVREMPPRAKADLGKGVTAITLPDTRWGRCDIKSLNLLANCMAMKTAARQGAFEPILHKDGLVTEAASAGLFFVKGGRLVTRENGPHILPSVTSGLIVAYAREAGIACEKRPYTLTELMAADEAFFTASSFAVQGIGSIDGQPVGAGVVGPVTKRIYELYMAKVKAAVDGNPKL